MDHPASSIIILIILLNNIEKTKEKGRACISVTTGIQGRGWRITNQQEAF